VLPSGMVSSSAFASGDDARVTLPLRSCTHPTNLL
jgi:hypothetical protein